MTETYDVTLDSVGYMVKPGTYQRYQDGQSEGRVGRVRLFDFYGGAKRTTQLERDRFMGGVGAWPTLDSQGVIAGPKETDRTLSVSPGMSPSKPRWTFVYDGTVYLVCGAELYSVAVSGGLFNGLTAVHALAADVVDCCKVWNVLYFAYGAGTNVGTYNLATSTYTAGAIAEDASLIGHGTASVWFVDPATPNAIKNSASSTLLTASDDVLRFVQIDGDLWVLTRQTVYKATDAQATVPLMAGTDDFAWAVGHFGRLWAWGGKEILYYDTADNEWKGTGIRGLSTLGACTVGSYLVVVVTGLVSGLPEMWVYDGRGWFELEDGSTAYDYPVSIYGSCDDADMIAGRGSTSNNAATWQFFDRSGSPAIRSSFEIISAMLDAGERDLDKVWRRAGVELATPDGRATSDSVTVAASPTRWTAARVGRRLPART